MGIRDRAKKTAAERWTTALEELGESTRQSYARELAEFLTWIENTPDELIDYWIEIRDTDENMALSDAVNDYITELDGTHTGGKQDITIKAIRKFFKVNGHQPVLDVSPRARNRSLNAATKQQIRDLIAYTIANPRNQALVAVIKDSGLRPSDVIRITIQDIKPLIDDPSIEWLVFKMPVQKTRRQGKIALPTLGIDAVKYIRRWLKQRSELGISSEPEDTLFVNIQDIVEHEISGEMVSSTVKGGAMTAKAVSVTIKDLCVRAGHPDISTNSLRSFQTTRLSVGGVPENKIKYIQGKHQGSSLENYLDIQAAEILPLYQAAYGELSLESQELEKLLAKQEIQNGETAALRQELDDIKNLLLELYTSPNDAVRERLEKLSLNDVAGRVKRRADKQ